ncbi:unnamed protein product [Heterotrigona itama]|uniref:PiggyBac transposable element-derived protein domain-containing protein n=1 Tax=Heterotrigona itama TaxID=395501 RepID=A0A6V7H388_9HYME|nr:unnamed protein product [Heterotrigona itama]
MVQFNPLTVMGAYKQRLSEWSMGANMRPAKALIAILSCLYAAIFSIVDVQHSQKPHTLLFSNEIKQNLETHQYVPLISDSEDTENSINDGIVGCRRKNKRPRVLSTSTDEDLNSNFNLENFDSNEILSTLSWSKNNFKPIIHAFNDQNSGMKGNLTPDSTPLDAFQLFFSEELVSHIVEETNNYFKFVIENTSFKTHSRTNSWKDTSVCKMYGFLTITMLMPRIKKLTLNKYWSTDTVIKTSIFRKIMDIVPNFTTIEQSANVVMTLLRSYLGKGHTVLTDSWYTSPHLYDLLHKYETNAFGTVRKNRKNMPHIEENMRKGKFDYRCTDNLLALRWRVKKDVWMLTSAHEPKMIEAGRINHITG